MIAKSERVAATLRREIIDGAIVPGTRLRQVEIAGRLGVSTTPVREAFAALLREGLIVGDEHKGVVVFDPSAGDVSENYAIRVELECLALEKAVPKMTERDLATLDAIVDEARSADLLRRVSLNRELHRQLYAPSAMPKLVAMIEDLRDATAAWLQFVASKAPLRDHEIAQSEHEAIVAACRCGDSVAATDLLSEHLSFMARVVERELSAAE